MRPLKHSLERRRLYESGYLCNLVGLLILQFLREFLRRVFNKNNLCQASIKLIFSMLEAFVS